MVSRDPEKASHTMSTTAVVCKPTDAMKYTQNVGAANAPALRPCARPQFPERGRARVRPGIAGRADLSCHCYVPKCPAAVDHGPADIDRGPAAINHGPAAVDHGRFPRSATPADYNDTCRDEDNS